MTRTRRIIPALLAVLAVSAIAVATASANEGEVVNKEGKALVKNKFTGTSGTTELESTGGKRIVCKKDTLIGKFSSKTEGAATIKFKECEDPGVGKCEGDGNKESSEIVALVVIHTHRKSQPSGEALLLWTYWEVSSTGVPLLATVVNPWSFFCNGILGDYWGSYLVVPVKQETLKKSWPFEAKQKSGKQEFTEYENEAKEKVKSILEGVPPGGSATEQVGQSGTENLEFEEEVEFR